MSRNMVDISPPHLSSPLGDCTVASRVADGARLFAGPSATGRCPETAGHSASGTVGDPRVELTPNRMVATVLNDGPDPVTIPCAGAG